MRSARWFTCCSRWPPHSEILRIRRASPSGWLGKFDPQQVTWFPAHYSSERMKTMVLDELDSRGIWAGRPEMWYSNLSRVGNIGSASIFVILDEMLNDGMISPGDTLLCMVPESGRFAVSFMHLTAVG
ncbi:hypothetical protein D5S18_22515 [Nocardia panacis]|uniref:Beta-ketoacyl-[acyl-carrier-protein] synthase III C-terminal domain-containing protein n=1 Tax=Nocardia panacis TaxID=2340916 RepID=A0A3A4KEI4_9NOCA|nr:3-oxoacyl-[acyl-carrier-protein] synthase III C-terminal domain-containing protein [Nocardia panacis]RJO72547.1 hypothetical protein D5S18_22515 [Nocardia panacis]